jgi:hypothetical protein
MNDTMGLHILVSDTYNGRLRTIKYGINNDIGSSSGDVLTLAPSARFLNPR